MFEKIKNKVVRKNVERADNYKLVFGSPQGRAVLYDLMEHCGMLRSSYTKDANEVLFREGERNVVLRILQILDQDVKQLLERIEEHEKNVE